MLIDACIDGAEAVTRVDPPDQWEVAAAGGDGVQFGLHPFVLFFLTGTEEQALQWSPLALEMASRVVGPERAHALRALDDAALEAECRQLLLLSRRPQLEALRRGFTTQGTLDLGALVPQHLWTADSLGALLNA